MSSVFDDVTAARTGVLDRLASGDPVSPEERQAVDQLAAGRQSEFRKGLRRFGYNASTTSRAFVGGLAEPFAPEFADEQFADAERIARSQPASLAPEIDSFRKVGNLRDAVSYASGALGEGLGSVGTMVAAGLLSRGAAFRASPALRNAAQYAGGVAAMLPQEGGETALTLRQNPEAMTNTTPAERAAMTLGRGAISSAMENIVPNLVLTRAITGQAGRINAGVRPALANVGRKTAGGVVGEAATEGAQELTGQFTERLADPRAEYDFDRALEAAVRGAITGGVLGGAGGTVQAVRSNIDAAAETAREAAVGEGGALDRAVEALDALVRDPETAGYNAAEATLGTLSEASSRARELGEEAGPVAAAGMDALAGLRQRFDKAVAGQLTPQNRRKYLELVENLRLLQPTEYERLRDALDTGNAETINQAIGDVAAQFYERVPRGTMENLRGIADWAKRFGRGVTNAAREGRKAAQSYSKDDITRFRAFLNDQHPKVLRTMDSTDVSDRLSRLLMTYRDNAQLLNAGLRPNDQAAMEYFEAETGVPLQDLLVDARNYANENVRRRDVERMFEESTGDSQLARVSNDMELLLTDDLREQFEAEGIEIGPGATDAADPNDGVQQPAVGSLGEQLEAAGVRRDDGELMNEEDTRRTPFNSLGVIKRVIAADTINGKAPRQKNPGFTLPAVLRSDTLTADQIGRLFGGKDSTNQGTRRNADWQQTELPLTDEQIAARTTEDGGYQQDFNSVDISAQAGTPQERGGSRENFEGFVPEFDGSNRDLNIQGYRLLAAISSMHSNGIDIPRSDIDPALLEEWGLDPDGEDIHIDVEMDPNTLGNDTVVQVGRRRTTIGDLNGFNRSARSLQSQLELLQNIEGEPSKRLRELKKEKGKLGKTADAASKGLYGFVARRLQAEGQDIEKLKVVERNKMLDEAVADYREYLSERIGDSETAQRDRRNQQRLYNALRDGVVSPEGVREAKFVLESAYDDAERAAFAREERELENAATMEEMENVESSGVDEDKLATEDEVLAWIDGIQLEYDSTDDLVLTLEKFETEAMDQWELQQEAFDREPGLEEPTVADRFAAEERAETRLRQQGIDRQKDDAQPAPDTTGQQATEVLPTGISRKLMNQLDGATTEEEFAAIRKVAVKNQDAESIANIDRAIDERRLELEAERELAELETMLREEYGEITDTAAIDEQIADLQRDETIEDMSAEEARLRIDLLETRRAELADIGTQREGEPKRSDYDTNQEFVKAMQAWRQGQTPATKPLTAENRQKVANDIMQLKTEEELQAVLDAIPTMENMTADDALYISKLIDERIEELKAAPVRPYVQRILDGKEYAKYGSIPQRTVRNWAKKYLDGADVRVIEFDPNDPDVQDFFSVAVDAFGEIPNGRAVKPNKLGPDHPALIFIKKGTRQAGTEYGRMATLAHEFGHIIDYLALENAPQEVKGAIDRAYNRAVSAFVNKGELTEGMMRASGAIRFIPNKDRNEVLTDPNITTEEGLQRVLKGVDTRNELGFTDYILSKEEFFAEQFAKYALRDPNVFAGEAKSVRNYIDRVIAKVKQFYQEVILKMDRTTPEFDAYMQWLGTPANERPPLPEFAPAATDEATLVEGNNPERNPGETNQQYVQRMRGQRAAEPQAAGREPPDEPPQGPPEGGETPPPPPEDGARERFRAIVKRLLGDRVEIEFDVTDLPEDVAGEYQSRYGLNLEDTGKALKKIAEQRVAEVRALKFKRNATQEQIDKGLVDERSEEEIKASIAALNEQADKYRKDLAVRGTIRVAAGMEAQAGLAEHEAFHAAFAIFFGDNNAADRRAVTTAFTQGVLGRRLRNYFRDNEQVLAVIDPTSKTFDAEEAAAYAFQVYLHDPQALQMGKKVEGIFNRFLAFLQGLVGYKTYEERARIIFNDLNSGRRAERGVSVLRENENIEKSMLGRSQDFVRSVGTGLMHMYDTVLSSTYSRMADSGNAAMAQIARLGYNATGEEGQGMIQLQRQATTRWSNQLKESLHALDAEELGQLHEAMLLEQDLPENTKLGNAQKRLRQLLKEVHQYQTDAGIDLGFREKYYPMIWSPEKVMADRQGFLNMLEQYPEITDEMLKTPEDIFDGIVSYEERGHEFQGVFGKDGEPVADSSRRRVLDFLKNEERAAYMEDDLVTTMAHYLNQSVRHAEYVRAYGKNGEHLKRLMGEIRGVYGGTQDDVELAKDYIDGLMGNKEIGMSRELKDLYGAATVYQNVRLLPLSVFSSLVDPLGVAVRTNSMGAAWDTFAYSMRNMFTDFRSQSGWTPDQWEQYASDMGTIDMSGTVKSIDKIYTGVTLRGKTREINDAFFKWNLLNGWVKNNHIMATKSAQLFLRRSAEGMFGEERSAENLQEVGIQPGDIIYDEALGRIRSTAPEILGYENAEQMEQQAADSEIAEAREQADRIQQAIHKIVRQSLIQPSSAEMPGWMSNPYLAPIAHLKTFVFGFNATILQRLQYEAERGNYNPIYYAAAYVPGMIAADFIKGFAGNGGEEPDWKKNWGLADYVTYGVHRSGLTGTGQFFVDMNNDVTRGGGGWESLAGPTMEQATDLMSAMSAKTSQPTETWMINALPANALYDQWLRDN